MKIRTCENPNLPRWNGRDFTFGTAECSRKFTFGSSTVASRCPVRVSSVTAHSLEVIFGLFVHGAKVKEYFADRCEYWGPWADLHRHWGQGLFLWARRFKWQLSGAEIQTIQDHQLRGSNSLFFSVDFSSKGSLWYHLSWEAHLGKHCDYPWFH